MPEILCRILFYSDCCSNTSFSGHASYGSHDTFLLQVLRPVCGSDHVTYDNECELRRQSCLNKRPVTVAFVGECSKCLQKIQQRYVDLRYACFCEAVRFCPVGFQYVPFHSTIRTNDSGCLSSSEGIAVLQHSCRPRVPFFVDVIQI